MEPIVKKYCPTWIRIRKNADWPLSEYRVPLCPTVGHSDWPAGVAGGAVGGQLQQEQHTQDEERQQQEDVHLHGPIISGRNVVTHQYPKIVCLMVKIPVKEQEHKINYVHVYSTLG